MERTFDETNEIFTNMSEEDYELTRQAANDFYNFGNRALLEIASERTGLTPMEILNWW